MKSCNNCIINYHVCDFRKSNLYSYVDNYCPKHNEELQDFMNRLEKHEEPPKGGSGVFDNQNTFCEKGEFVIPKQQTLFIQQMKMMCELTKEFRLLAEQIIKLKS